MQQQLNLPIPPRFSHGGESMQTRSSLPPTGKTYFEFFAGGGMARLGLGSGWKCLFSNDFDYKKAAVYDAYWGDGAMTVADIRSLDTMHLPGKPTMAWASFPCQDLSLAGMGAGLRGDRSGTFWPFWNLIESLKTEGRAPKIVVLENVCGALTSHDGKDFRAIAAALGRHYNYGAVVINASRFVPQSRPRLFFIGFDKSSSIPAQLVSESPSALWHTKALLRAHANLPLSSSRSWLWWNLPKPPSLKISLSEIIDKSVPIAKWHSPLETSKLLSMMSPRHCHKIAEARRDGRILYGTAYKRTRVDEKGEKAQRAEVRFDGIAGCLRTSSGGSSRQVVIEVHGNHVRSRLITIAEASRLMGLPESYPVPANYNEAYHLLGDGLVVPAVEFLRNNLLDHLASYNAERVNAA